MSDYRRCFIPGGMVFLTLVTYRRRRILTTPQGREFLRRAIETVRGEHAFSIVATVLIPDHWHLIMQLPVGDAGYSLRIKRIKEEFTRSWLHAGLPETSVTESQATRGERGVWQPRFWEHTILDEANLEQCVDYIHWNPCKHELVNCVGRWPWSSFHRFVRLGQYEADWEQLRPDSIVASDDWGEPQ